MRYFISDTHFGHTNIIRYENRPFGDAVMMDEVMIARWNETVKFDDTVYFLGDFAFGSLEYCHSMFTQLWGNKVAIRGNHDGSVSKLHNIGFPVVLESAMIKIDRYDVMLTHHPVPNKDVYNLHGHVHSKAPFEFIEKEEGLSVGYCCNISVEVTDYRPVSEKQILGLIKKAVKKA